jgi:hypothetical protein
MATDIGIAIDILRRKERSSEAEDNLGKLLLHIHTIFAFLFGGIGVLIYRPSAASC